MGAKIIFKASPTNVDWRLRHLATVQTGDAINESVIGSDVHGQESNGARQFFYREMLHGITPSASSAGLMLASTQHLLHCLEETARGTDSAFRSGLRPLPPNSGRLPP